MGPGANFSQAETSNVVALKTRQVRQPVAQRLDAHAKLLLHNRRSEGEVTWLKENAEFLNILNSTSAPSAAVLPEYEEIYGKIDQTLGQFPQYYRLILSICLDLEDLGMTGSKGAAMCDWVVRQGLAEAELSDLQRAEARRLLARRVPLNEDPELDLRLMRFASRAETFALPNIKAAYELTHIVFYATEYGTTQVEFPAPVMRALNYVGLLAYLDQNHDLLSEVCIALRYAGAECNVSWEASVFAALTGIDAQNCRMAEQSQGDAYHEYFVCSWLAGLAKKTVFPAMLSVGPASFVKAPPVARPLLSLAQAALNGVSPDWKCARRHIRASLDEDGQRVLEAAEHSAEDFEAFFRIFARAARP